MPPLTAASSNLLPSPADSMRPWALSRLFHSKRTTASSGSSALRKTLAPRHPAASRLEGSASKTHRSENRPAGAGQDRWDQVYHRRRAIYDLEEGGVFEPVVPGLERLGIVFINVYALGEPGGPWVLVDAGLRGSAGYIRRAVEGRFGTQA